MDNVTLFSRLVILFSSTAFLHVAICQPDPVSEKEPPNQYPLEIKESASDGITYSSIPGGSTVRCKYFNSHLSAPIGHFFQQHSICVALQWSINITLFLKKNPNQYLFEICEYATVRITHISGPNQTSKFKHYGNLNTHDKPQSASHRQPSYFLVWNKDWNNIFLEISLTDRYKPHISAIHVDGISPKQ